MCYSDVYQGLSMRRAKIIATLGPASDTVEKIKELILAGMDVARVNMSHGTHDGHAKVISNIREASKISGKEVGVLLDLQGPKIRVDKVGQPLELQNGEEWVIGQSKLATDKKYSKYKDKFIPTIYENLVEDCHDGARILFDDGLISAEAIERDGDVYKIKILVGGKLKSNKGINLPDCDVSAPSFTEKDRKDLMFGLGEGVDFIALSFVRKRKDVQEVKSILHSLKKTTPVIAKIEKPQAIDNLDEIMKSADIVMVARGDMGVEVGNHQVPGIQKLIIQKCNQTGTPVITATQMLESMTENPTPTRAEASDVANAVWDGTDAVMLSGESAAGKYPIEAVTMMDQIVIEAEKTPKERPFLRHLDLSNVNAAVMVAASMIAEKVHAAKILSVTESGNSCQKIAKFRPSADVLGVTNNIDTVRRISLYWGIQPYYLVNYRADSFNFQKDVLQKVKVDLTLKNGDKLVITRGDGRFFSHGSSNSVKVHTIKDSPKILGGSDGVDIGRDDKKRILLDTNLCAGCQNCINICPHDIWTVSDDEEKRTIIDSNKIGACTMDNQCVEACPTGSIEILPNFQG